MAKKADPYTMNQDHANNPVEKYKTYDTSTGNEDPDMRKPWEAEGRTETGHPAPAAEAAPMAAPMPAPAAAPAAAPAPEAAEEPARQAVMAARQLEDKALKCITIAQRMLPGADDSMVEAQATDLMYMPERCVMASLQRQSELADKLASECNEDEKDDEAEKAAAAKKDEEKEPEAPVAPAADAAPAPVAPVQAAEEVPAAPAPAADAAPAAAPAAEPKKDEKEEKEEKEASNGDLLDLIFADDSTVKTGAKKLSGIVKQASTGDVNLAGLWDAPPDVSKAFK